MYSTKLIGFNAPTPYLSKSFYSNNLREKEREKTEVAQLLLIRFGMQGHSIDDGSSE